MEAGDNFINLSQRYTEAKMYKWKVRISIKYNLNLSKKSDLIDGKAELLILLLVNLRFQQFLHHLHGLLYFLQVPQRSREFPGGFLGWTGREVEVLQ